ncbi:hypothetical protein NP493_312g10045 [Ridgeia piscesae]|uniref:Uncharacterized protein n=1 Tax=Ridgeia piscesae TaxID=27915 RepID=A0AAD9NV27_RIDPI|nr:hypothetical protein NP493_312g10045 [Ridgeia piscesae]
MSTKLDRLVAPCLDRPMQPPRDTILTPRVVLPSNDTDAVARRVHTAQLHINISAKLVRLVAVCQVELTVWTAA